MPESFGAHVYTSEERWVSGTASLYRAFSTPIYMEFAVGIPGGTSGGPICNDQGEVVGIMSQVGMRGDEPVDSQTVLLANALPQGIAKELRLARK